MSCVEEWLVHPAKRNHFPASAAAPRIRDLHAAQYALARHTYLAECTSPVSNSDALPCEHLIETLLLL
jgi:hypothetical protein